jgi:glycosyltransferase involved in cell wall biosynthesis
LSTGIVVLNDVHERILSQQYRCDKCKLYLIPHGIPQHQQLETLHKSKEMLDLKGHRVIFFFGYLSRYKGIDVLLNAFEILSKDEDMADVVLIIGAGEHPRLKNEPWYMQYTKKLKEKAALLGRRIRWIGFVPDLSLLFESFDRRSNEYSIRVYKTGYSIRRRVFL